LLARVIAVTVVGPFAVDEVVDHPDQGLLRERIEGNLDHAPIRFVTTASGWLCAHCIGVTYRLSSASAEADSYPRSNRTGNHDATAGPHPRRRGRADHA